MGNVGASIESQVNGALDDMENPLSKLNFSLENIDNGVFPCYDITNGNYRW